MKPRKRGGYSPARGLQNTKPQWVAAPGEKKFRSYKKKIEARPQLIPFTYQLSPLNTHIYKNYYRILFLSAVRTLTGLVCKTKCLSPESAATSDTQSC